MNKDDPSSYVELKSVIRRRLRQRTAFLFDGAGVHRLSFNLEYKATRKKRKEENHMKAKRVMSALLAAVMMVSIAGCGTKNPPPQTSDEGNGGTTAERQVIAQGITDDTIKIGCTYSVSGAMAIVGVPMMDTIRGVFNRVNENGGIGGRKLELVYLDDGGDAANSRALTERLVEEEKVFAITAMPGNAVNTCIDYVDEMGIPVVDMVTGLDIGYSEKDPGGNIFPVQPSWGQDGSFIAARVFHSNVYGPNKDQPLPEDAKIGVVYANNDQGSCLYEGFKKQVEREGMEDRIVYAGFSAGEYSPAIQTLKDEGCDVAVMLMGVAAIKGAVAAMDDLQYEVPVFTFYGNSSVVAWSKEIYKESRPYFTTGWSDYTSEKALAALEDFYDVLSYCDVDEATKKAYHDDAYAQVGYIAADILVRGLQRLEDSGLDYSWENFIACMEDGEFELITGGSISYADGVRLGATREALFEFLPLEQEDGTVAMDINPLAGFETIEEIMAH